MRSLTSVAAGVLAAFIFVTGASAQSVQLLGDYRDWSAYTASQGAGQLCFVLSEPQEVDPEPDGYTKAYLYLTHRESEGIRNEFNLIAGYTFAADSEAELTIGGQSYALFTEGDAAWLEDASLADTVAGRMRAGSSLVVEGTSERGIKVKQTFSLSGVTAASRAIDNECR